MKWIVCLFAMVIACGLAAQEKKPPDIHTLPVRKWMAIGPFGHPELKKRPNTPHPAWPAHNFVCRIYTEKAKYPLDQVIDLSAVYKGDLTRNCDDKELEVKWQLVKGREGIVSWPRNGKLAKGVGQCYFSTWIWAPEQTTVGAAFPAYGEGRQAVAKFGASVRVWINGQAVKSEKPRPDNPWLFHPVDNQQIMLKAGWNHVYVKVFSTWSGCRAGLVLKATEEVLWRLKLSPEPPPEIGAVFTISGEKAEPPTLPSAKTIRPAGKPAAKQAPGTGTSPDKIEPKKNNWSFKTPKP